MKDRWPTTTSEILSDDGASSSTYISTIEVVVDLLSTIPNVLTIISPSSSIAAMGKRKRNKGYGNDIASEQPHYKKPYEPSDLPTGVNHYRSLSEVPWDLQKYWRQAYSMFSRYDDGIWMTDQAWYEVTHESIAQYVLQILHDPSSNFGSKIAEHISNTAPEDKSIIIDPFCGVGGNSIAFALSGRWQRVYAIEKDEATLACAKHNAEIYGVADQITWFCGDCFEVLGLKEPGESGTDDGLWQLKAVMGAYGVIFASPPWGGKRTTSCPICEFLNSCRSRLQGRQGV